MGLVIDGLKNVKLVFFNEDLNYLAFKNMKLKDLYPIFGNDLSV